MSEYIRSIVLTIAVDTNKATTERHFECDSLADAQEKLAEFAQEWSE